MHSPKHDATPKMLSLKRHQSGPVKQKPTPQCDFPDRAARASRGISINRVTIVRGEFKGSMCGAPSNG